MLPVKCQHDVPAAFRSLTISLYSLVYQSTAGTVHGQHIKVDTTNLRVEVAAYGRARRYVRFHNVPNNLNGVRVLQDARILLRLLDDLIPLALD